MHEPITLELLTGLGLGAEQAASLLERIQPLTQEAAAQTQRADQLQAQLDALADELHKAQGAQAQLAEVQARLAEAEERLREAALIAEIQAHKPVDPQLILRLIDRSKLGFDAGAFTGLSEQIESIKAAVPCLFRDAADPAGGRADPGCAPSAFDMNAFLRGER